MTKPEAKKPPAADDKEKSKADVEDDIEDKPMTFWEHLDELRKRVVYSLIAFIAGCFAAWEIREPMLAILVKPFHDSWKAQNIAGDPSLHFGTPSAAFLAYIKLAMIGGAAAAAPIIFYQLWAFIAPGLYAREKRYVIPFVLLSTCLFIGGSFFGWRAAFPITFDYFLSMSGTVNTPSLGLGPETPEAMAAVIPTVMIGEYVDFCAQMLLGFGIIFEIPLLALFLSVTGIVNYLHLIRFGRWFILAAFIIAAIVTPPDATSQLVMAIPMCILYGLSIGLAYVFGKPPTEAQREAFRNRKKKPEEAAS